MAAISIEAAYMGCKRKADKMLIEGMGNNGFIINMKQHLLKRTDHVKDNICIEYSLSPYFDHIRVFTVLTLEIFSALRQSFRFHKVQQSSTI